MDGTEIRVPTRALLESWILAGVVEPDDRVARPGEADFILVRELEDVSDAVETGAVVHGPRTVPTHPPVFAVVDDGKTAPPPVPDLDPDVLELEPLEGDTIQDAPVMDGIEPITALEVAKTRVAQVEDDRTAHDYPSEPPREEHLPPEGWTLDEMLPDLEPMPESPDPAPRTGRVAVAPTTLAPLIVAGTYVSDQAIDPSERPGVLVPHIDADGEIIESQRKSPRTGRIAVRATDIDAAHRDIDLQSTHPERSGISDPSERPTQPTVPRVTARPDASLQSPEPSSKPSALHRTLNKAPSAPVATEALSRPIQRAGALGGSYSDDLEIRALQRERRRTVGITLALIVVVAVGVAFWWNGQESSVSETEEPSTSKTSGAVVAPQAPQEKPAEPVAAVAPKADEPAAAEVAPKNADEPAAETPEEVAESEAQRQAAETARQEAEAAIDEELESDAKVLDAKPSSKKTSKTSKKATGGESSVRGYDALMRAAKKLRRKQPSKALALYKQALAQRPSNPDALSNVGKLQMKSGQTSAAINTFKRCRKAMPRYTPCMYWHGRALEKAGRRPDAMKAYEKYLDVNPDGSQAVDVRKRLSR